MSRDNRSTSNDSSLAYSAAKSIVKRTTRFTESITTTTTTTTKQQNSVNIGKENRFAKEPEAAGSIVKQLKVYYEERSISRTHRVVVDGVQNATSMGAVKKRRVSEKSTDVESQAKIAAKKRSGIHDDEAFGKPRFKIYTDDVTKFVGQASIAEKEGKKSERKLENEATNKCELYRGSLAIDKRLDKIRCPVRSENFQARVTPLDVLPVPSMTKKVKVVHRKSLSTKPERAESATAIVTRDSEYELPYDDYFIEHELEKEIWASKLSKNLRRQNITITQRLIVVKFLTHLQSHLFLPSFLLYQTVRLFDAVLDAKVVEVEDMQLIALAAMWIALKREHIGYNVPTAKKMISFAKDLYGGNVELLLKCESEILRTLDFNIVFPDAISIMCYNITKCLRSQFLNSHKTHQAYCCGSYMIDLSLFDEKISKFSVVLLAAAAAEAALYFTIEEVNVDVEPSWNLWRANHIANSYSDEEISTVRTLLIRKVFESQQRYSTVEIVFKKYLRSRYGRISHFLGNKVKLYLREE